MRSEHFRLLLALLEVSGIACSSLRLKESTRGQNGFSSVDDTEIRTTLNDTAGEMLQMLLLRYPKFMEITIRVVNETVSNNTGSMDEGMLCELIVSRVRQAEDFCIKFVVATPWCDKAANTTLLNGTTNNGTSLQRLCSNVVTTTTTTATTTATTTVTLQKTTTTAALTNNSTANVTKSVVGVEPAPPMPWPPIPPDDQIQERKNVASSYFFAAIKIIARTAIISFKKNCHKRNGTYIEKINACRLGTDTNAGRNHTFVYSTASATGNKALSIIFNCGNSLSLVGIILLILEYGLCKKKLSLFERNIVSLCGALFLLHILLLLISNVNTTRVFCKTTGILLHWATLASFLWMLSISYDIFKTFRGMHHIDSETTSRRFKQYVVFVSAVSTTIVLLCVFIGLPKEDFSGYGYQGKCFVAKFWANLFAFTVPIAAILLINTAFMIATLIKLRAQQKKNAKTFAGSSSEHASSRRKVIISLLMLKLSVLFGLGWMLGFVAAGARSNEVSSLYGAIVSLQGFLVFLCFGCHKELLSKYCNRQGSGKGSFTSTTGAVTETSRV